MPITVSEADYRSDVVYPIVITTIINQYSVSQVVIDSRSQVNLITLNVLKQMKVDLSRLKQVQTPLIGFSESMTNHPEGRIEFPVRFGTNFFKDILVDFTVVDLVLSYNVVPASTSPTR